MKTLKLFNAVLMKQPTEKVFLSEDGFIIEKGAVWAKDKIVAYLNKEKLNGNEINKTFHKSWKKIKETEEQKLDHDSDDEGGDLYDKGSEMEFNVNLIDKKYGKNNNWTIFL